MIIFTLFYDLLFVLYLKKPEYIYLRKSDLIYFYLYIHLPIHPSFNKYLCMKDCLDTKDTTYISYSPCFTHFQSIWGYRLNGETWQPFVMQCAICCVHSNPIYKVLCARRLQSLTGDIAECFTGCWINKHFLAPALFFPCRTHQPHEKLCWPHKKVPCRDPVSQQAATTTQVEGWKSDKWEFKMI